MGGHARGRCWALRLARRGVVPGQVNQYGEAITQGKVVGVETGAGRWLVSRRIDWQRVTQAQAQESGAERGPQARAWSRFNNCTARLTGQLRAALLAVKPGAIETDRWHLRRAAQVAQTGQGVT